MPNKSDFAYLSDDDLAALGIGPGEVVEAIEAAVRDKQEGRLWAPPKCAIKPGDGRYIMATLAASDTAGIVAVKTVMSSPENAGHGLPTINGAILILDSRTGLLRAVMGANWVTAVRTAGLSAVAAKRLAAPDAASVAFIGCGVQAHSHLDAFADMFALREVRAFGRSRAKVENLCAAARKKGLAAQGVETAQAAIDGADIVVSCVSLNYTAKPFLDANWLKPGAFAAILDQALPWREAGLRAFGRIYVDDRVQEAAFEQKLVPPDAVSGDLAMLVCGEPQVAHDPDVTSAFAFRGMALSDLALAGLAYRRWSGT